MRRRLPWWLYTLVFVALPIAEITLIVQLGQAVGPWWTLLLLLLAGAVGSMLIKHEGGRAWRALQEALAAGRAPARELADGALILVGGTLLLTPGFLSDVVGLFCVLPLTRPLARRALTRVLSRRLAEAAKGLGRPGSPTVPPAARRPGHRPPAGGDVVRGEVVDDGRDASSG